MSRTINDLERLYDQIAQEVRREVDGDPAFDPLAISQAAIDWAAGRRERPPLTVASIADKRFKQHVGDEEAERYLTFTRALEAIREPRTSDVYANIQTREILADVIRWELDFYANYGKAIFIKDERAQLKQMGKKYATLYGAADRIPNRPPLPERHTDPVVGLQSMIAWCDEPAAWTKPRQGEPKPTRKKKTARPPEKREILAWQTYQAIPNQTRVAAILSKELGRSVNQVTVSRWVNRVQSWIDAGNPQPQPTGVTVTAVDPATLEQGPRTDGRTARQRGKRRE